MDDVATLPADPLSDRTVSYHDPGAGRPGRLFTRPVLDDFAQELPTPQPARVDPGEMARLTALLRASTPG